MATVVVCGEALMDVFALADTATGMALEARIGGSPFNVAVGLARLGQPVAFLTSEISAPTDVREASVGRRLECLIDSLALVPGRYRIDVMLLAQRHVQDGLDAAAFFDVEPGVVGERPTPVAGSAGDVVLAHRWRLPA